MIYPCTPVVSASAVCSIANRLPSAPHGVRVVGLGSVLAGAAAATDVPCAVHEGYVGESPGKVPQQAPLFRVVLLRDEADSQALVLVRGWLPLTSYV